MHSHYRRRIGHRPDSTTTVECSANDSTGNTSSDDFTVTVLGC